MVDYREILRLRSLGDSISIGSISMRKRHGLHPLDDSNGGKIKQQAVTAGALPQTSEFNAFVFQRVIPGP